MTDSCTGCHSEATAGDVHSLRKARGADYDGDGDTAEPLAAEVEGLAGDLLAQIRLVASGAGTPLVYDGWYYPYYFNDLDEDGVGDPAELISPNRFTGWTPALLKAAHNHQIYQKEPGAWAHNTNYIVQLLVDSLEALGADVSGASRP